MSVLMLEHVFDRQSTYQNISKYTRDIQNNAMPDRKFKSFLKELENEFQQDISLLTRHEGIDP